MKSYVLMGAVSLSLLMACSSSKKTASGPQGVWQSSPVTIDGEDTEWAKPFATTTKDGLSYSITNDATQVYICLKTSGDVLMRKIMRSGLNIYVNTKGKKQEEATLQFPLPMSIKDIRELIPTADNNGSSASNTDNGGNRPTMRGFGDNVTVEALQKRDYSLNGFLKGNGVYNYALANEAGIQFKVGISKYKEFVYEVAIPLSALYEKPADAVSAGKGSVAVGFLIKGMGRPDQSGGAMGGGGLPGGGMGGGMRGGGGMGGGMRGGGGMPGGGMGGPGGGGDMEKMMNDTKAWKVVPLAKKAA